MVYVFLLIALVLVSPHSVFNQIKSNYELEKDKYLKQLLQQVKNISGNLNITVL